jgi:CarboxypepD_reg-like domain
MSEKTKHINPFIRFLDYLSQKLKGKERNAFEKELEKDPFEKEALEGLSQLSAKEFSADMIELNARLHQRIYKKSRIPYYRVAAGIAAMIVVSVLFFTLTNRKLEDIPAQKSVAESKIKASEKDSIIPDVMKEKISVEGEREGEREKGKVIEQSFNDEMETEESPIATIEMQNKEVNQLMEPISQQTNPQKVNIVQEKEKSGYALTEDQNRAPEKSRKSNRLSVPREAKRAIEPLPGMISAKSVQGKVIASDDSLPIPGARVVVKGSDKGTVTDIDGYFVIPLEKADSNITLTASFIGMETKEMQASAGSSAEIVMDNDVASLDEVVVIGYGVHMDNSPSSYAEPIPIPDYKSFNKYIENHIQFPDSVSEISRAVVICKFVVGTNGKPKEFEIIRSPDDAFSKEVKRLLFEGPDWKPSEIEGNTIEEQVRLRIVFKK